jgi:hypothetical protein
MTHRLKQVLAAAAALAIVAPFGGVHALLPADPGLYQKEEPKDCKMKPEDPRCKDDKKY